MTWETNFHDLIIPLSQKYHILAVNYSGFDGSDDDFISMIAETAKIEDWIISHGQGHLNAVYGSSLGGSFASLLMQRKRVHFDHVLIGSSDLDQASPLLAKIETAIMAYIFFGAASSTAKEQKLVTFLVNKLGMPQESTERLIRTTLIILRQAGKTSVIHQFYSDLVTPLDDDIHVSGTKIHVLHSKKMDAKYLERYFQHYHHPDIISLDMPHEAWLKDSRLMLDLFDHKITAGEHA